MCKATGRSEMHCSTCLKGALIEIRMRVGGSELTFRRCGRCEAQGWESDEGHIPLTRVLELARGV
jgi:hypothetical protein